MSTDDHMPPKKKPKKKFSYERIWGPTQGKLLGQQELFDKLPTHRKGGTPYFSK